MNSKLITIGLIGIIIGIGGTLGVNAMMQSNVTSNQTMMTGSSMSMDNMNNELKGKTGDAFDQAFLEMMIAHHQGAIDMATLATTRAKQEEIKTLSQAIIAAQKQEIQDMQKWQMDWGFMSNDSSMPGMNHGSSN